MVKEKVFRAKAQRRKAKRKEDAELLCVFLCAFAPLREILFLFNFELNSLILY